MLRYSLIVNFFLKDKFFHNLLNLSTKNSANLQLRQDSLQVEIKWYFMFLAGVWKRALSEENAVFFKDVM